MASSGAETVDEYLDELPEHRRAAIERVRETILANLPEGSVEAMNWGMISYELPLEVYPDTYNGKPLMYAALASQKHHMAVYLSAVYGDDATLDWFVHRYRETGKKLDMGKSCVRFTDIEQLPLDLIGEVIARTPVEDFIGLVEASHS